jgi:hypothetical protein
MNFENQDENVAIKTAWNNFIFIDFSISRGQMELLCEKTGVENLVTYALEINFFVIEK